MPTADLVTLIGSVGFPIALIVGLLWFVKRDFWQWYVKYIDERSKAQDQRHLEYIQSIERSTSVISTLVELLTRIDERLENHTDRLKIIEAASRAAAASRGH